MRNKYLSVICVVWSFCLLTGCINDDYTGGGDCYNEKNPLSLKMRVGIPLSNLPTSRAANDLTEKGTEAENYAAFDEYDCRVLIFSDGKYVSEFVPEMTVTSADEYTVYYTFIGPVPSVTASGQKIEKLRVMVLANWRLFDRSNYAGFNSNQTTTLDDISVNGTAFNYTMPNSSGAESWRPSLDGNKKLIPMFGLSGEITVPKRGSINNPYVFDYEEPIMLLRALAKVEIVDALPSGGPVTSVSLDRSYATGRFIPDFKTNSEWYKPEIQVTTPSLPADMGTAVTNLQFFEEKTNAAGHKVWSAYIPEMNLSSDLTGGLSRPEFTVSTAGNSSTFKFDNYINYEQATGNQKLKSVLRNHIYRYTIDKLKGVQVGVTLTVSAWTLDEDEEWDMQDNVVVGEDGILTWSWSGDENFTGVKGYDDPKKAQLVMAAGTSVSAVGKFTIDSPKGATWHAYLRPLSNIEDAFMFVDERGNELSELPSGTVDGKPATIRLRNRYDSTSAENNEALLVIMVETADNRWLEADVAPDGFSNYKIIQNRTDIYDGGESEYESNE